MFTSAEPAYTFPVVEEELPDDEKNQAAPSPLAILYFALISAILYFGQAIFGLRRILNTMISWQAVIFLCVVATLASYAIGAPSPHVRASSYFNDGADSHAELNLQWVADTGTNRFVTNDMNDFIPGTVKQTSVNVAVGGGNTISPCSGSVLIRGLDHNVTIRCDDVILLPKCARN